MPCTQWRECKRVEYKLVLTDEVGFLAMAPNASSSILEPPYGRRFWPIR